MQAPSKHCFLGCSICLGGVSCGYPAIINADFARPAIPCFRLVAGGGDGETSTGIQDPSCHQISHERWVPFVPSGSYALLRYRSCMNAATGILPPKDCSDNSHAATGVFKHPDYDKHHFHRS